VLEYGGAETARRLLWRDGVSDGFTTLWELKRLDPPVEAFVLRPEYAPLFREEERGIPRPRWSRSRGCLCSGASARS
jgi:hypothetical protein